MEISDSLRCLFTAEVEEVDGSYVIRVPTREVTNGEIQLGEVSRVALLPTESDGLDNRPVDQSQTNTKQDQRDLGPPVAVGDERTVEIESIGDQGDGIARVERGYVVIVEDAEKNERVTIEIKNVSESVAFGEVIKRHDYYE